MTTRKSPTKEQRKLVYQMYDGRCAYCGCELEFKDMQVDHFNSVYAYDGKNRRFLLFRVLCSAGCIHLHESQRCSFAEYFVPDQKWIGYTTLAHLVAEKMRNSEKDA